MIAAKIDNRIADRIHKICIGNFLYLVATIAFHYISCASIIIHTYNNANMVSYGPPFCVLMTTMSPTWSLLGLLADIDGAKFLRLLVYHVYIAEVLAILGTLGTVPVEDVVMIPAWFAHQEINMTHQSAFAKPYHEPYLV